jgi:ABC-type sugar transport system ATPase subunit
MREIADAGSLLIFITHRMDEVKALSDRISILRGGRVVRTEEAGVSSSDELLAAMAPRLAEELSHV